jgi:hypothetical protein
MMASSSPSSSSSSSLEIQMRSMSRFGPSSRSSSVVVSIVSPAVGALALPAFDAPAPPLLLLPPAAPASPSPGKPSSGPRLFTPPSNNSAYPSYFCFDWVDVRPPPPPKTPPPATGPVRCAGAAPPLPRFTALPPPLAPRLEASCSAARAFWRSASSFANCSLSAFDLRWMPPRGLGAPRPRVVGLGVEAAGVSGMASASGMPVGMSGFSSNRCCQGHESQHMVQHRSEFRGRPARTERGLLSRALGVTAALGWT